MALSDDKILATMPDAGQLYVNSLKDSLDNAKQALDKKKADYDALLSEFKKAVSWESQLRKCLDAVKQTDLLSAELDNLLKNAKKQVEKVGQVSQCSVVAFRHMMNDLVTVSCCIEKYRNYINGLFSAFPKGPNSNISDKDPLVESFNKLLTGLEDAYKCAVQLIKDMLLVLQNGEMLWKGLYLLPQPTQGVKDPSLLNFLDDILNEFNDDKGQPACDAAEFLGSSCSKPSFPLSDNNNAFLKSLEDEQKAAWNKLYTGTNSIRSQLENTLQAKNQAQTCYDAINTAYQAALAANACKN
ncbi:MAG: hypothetical protein KDC61_11790 [Saprospiraceae bacterium]|nr:hypothetical protein [Saprospiraceae bacterium]